MAQPPQTIAITGASRGLGRALALEYAGAGRLLALAARDMMALEDVARACRQRGAEVMLRRLDVSEAAAIETWVSEIESVRPIDLMIVNAGIFSGRGKDDPLEPLDSQMRVIEVDLLGAMATAHSAACAMRARRRGHIALVSSLAALQPLADAPAYSAAKAGLRAYGEALGDVLQAEGILVSVVLPGHIETAQTAVHVGPTLGIISATRAAATIRHGLERGSTSVAFPAAAHWLVRLGRLLPRRLRSRINEGQRFHVATSAPVTDRRR